MLGNHMNWADYSEGPRPASSEPLTNCELLATGQKTAEGVSLGQVRTTYLHL